ncbi:hypothetical protein KHO57_gp087 [Mycobacterium phage Phabba]|uniref:Uncharacterized protein n=1 Tax=Mycobacterium phage Phabba TaxID=2027899 RepID=A0A249XSU8_9CAUD|nr:hypothetical protein KHO57_gp087 [Mycobacterium phage Phabba]ASZ74817.1 hypothetical protein SEA_PHABBA_280 [Mycobacterium phage Phabba]
MAETPELDELIRKGLEDQAQVDNYGEGTVTITGPIDLDELAEYVIGWLPPVVDPIETDEEAAKAHAAQNLKVAKVFVSEGHEFTKQHAFFEFSDESVVSMSLDQFRAIDREAEQNYTLDKLLFGEHTEIVSMWPDFEDGRKLRVLITGPGQPAQDAEPGASAAYIRQALVDLIKAIDEGPADEEVAEDGIRTT